MTEFAIDYGGLLDGMQAFDMHEGYVLFQARTATEKAAFEDLIRFVDLMSIKLNDAIGIDRAQGKADFDYLRTQKNIHPVPVVVKFVETEPGVLGYSRVTWTLIGEPVEKSATGSSADDDERYHGEDRTFTIDDLARDPDLRSLVQEHQDQVSAVSGTIYLSETLLDEDGFGSPVTQTYNVAETGVHEFRHMVMDLYWGIEEVLRILSEDIGDHYCGRESEVAALNSDAEVEVIARHDLDGGQNEIPSVHNDYVDQGLIPEEECK